MEGKKNSNIVTIILFVFLLVLVGVICYLLGSNSVKDGGNNNNSNPTEEKENDVDDPIKQENTTTSDYIPKCSNDRIQQQNLLVDIDETKYNNIVDYVKEQENVEILIEYGIFNSDHPEADDEGWVSGIYKLTEFEKTDILTEIKNSSYKIELSELGGPFISELKITYERNNKQYYVSYAQMFAMDSNDGNIYKILDKSVNNTLTGEVRKYCGYHFDKISTASSLFDKLISY